MKLTAKERRRIEKINPSPRPLVKNFMPPGRSQQIIYAVTVRQHPDKVKIGMTTRWKSRRYSYEHWDLSPGDAMSDSRVFVISDEYVDLRKVENHILATCPLPLAFGAEWFFGSIDDAGRHIDRFFCEQDIPYDSL